MHKPQTAKSWQRRFLRSVAIYALLPYLSVTVIFTLAQRRLMYRPLVASSLTVNQLKLDAQHFGDVQIKTADDEILNGWVLKSPTNEISGGKLVIYFPGNSMNRYERIYDLQEVASYGYDVLIFDYRGFGDSTGSPTEFNISSDAKLIWQYATGELKYSEKDIVVFGESLGGAVTLSLWSEDTQLNGHESFPHPAALILSSTFASMPRTVKFNYPWFPFQYLVFDRWPSIDRIPRVACPITILHGTDDDMIPISEARALAAASTHATFIEIPGAGHNDVPMRQLQTQLQKHSAFAGD